MHTEPSWLAFLPERLAQRLRDRPGFLAALQNAGWLFADKLLRMAVGVLVGAWSARYLGPSQFGELAYVLSVIALFGALANLGLDGVAIRDMARRSDSAPEVLGAVLRMRIVAGGGCWLAAVAAVALLQPGDLHTLLLVAVAGATLVLQAADTVDLWFQSQTQSRRTVIAKGYAYLVANAIKIALILAQAPLLAFVAVGVVELAVSAAVLWRSYRAFPAAGPWTWQTQHAWRLLRESVPYLLAGLAVLIYMRIDQLMLRAMVGEHALGLYSAALPLSSALHVVPMALCASLAPALARLRQQDAMAYAQALQRLFSAMWWLMLPLAGAMALLSGPLMRLLYGPAYADAGQILALHAFTSVPVALGVAQSLWIVNEGRNMMSLYRTATGALCNVALNLVLIPRWGALGAAMAAVTAQFIAAVVSNAVLAPDMLRMQWGALVRPALFSRRQSAS